jgi:hypothetical protein
MSADTPSPEAEPRSYHDIEVEFDGKRVRLFDAPFSWNLMCARTTGWQLRENETLLAGEYDTMLLRVYVAGQLVCGR